jgi:hypothetical protein
VAAVPIASQTRIKKKTTRKLRITNQTDEEIVDDREDVGRMVFEREEADKNLP